MRSPRSPTSKRLKTPTKAEYEIYNGYKQKVRDQSELVKLPVYMRNKFVEERKARNQYQVDLMYETNGSNFSINPELPKNENDGELDLEKLKQKLS